MGYERQRKINSIYKEKNDINCNEIRMSFIEACAEGDAVTIDWCLENNIDLQDHCFSDIKINSRAVYDTVDAYVGFKKKALCFLVDHGADVNCLVDGETPLMQLIRWANCYIVIYDHPLKLKVEEQREYLELCKILVENGADITCKNKDGVTLLEMSSKLIYCMNIFYIQSNSKLSDFRL